MQKQTAYGNDRLFEKLSRFYFSTHFGRSQIQLPKLTNLCIIFYLLGLNGLCTKRDTKIKRIAWPLALMAWVVSGLKKAKKKQSYVNGPSMNGWELIGLTKNPLYQNKLSSVECIVWCEISQFPQRFLSIKQYCQQ